MYKNKNQAFTLVELIVVITILAILGTIGFISYKNYASEARDSNRKITLNTMTRTFEYGRIQSGILPLPDEPIPITLSGALISYQ